MGSLFSVKQEIKGLYVLAWVIFIGLCIEAGGIITNAIYALAINSDLAEHFWGYIDLSSLYKHDVGQFFAIVLLMSIGAVLKTLLFWLIINVLDKENLDLAQPFSKKMGRLISNLSYLTLGIGFFSSWGVGYTEWVSNQGVMMPSIQKLKFGGADVWFFMGVALLVIARIFKRGIEIQEENELTV